MFDQTSVAYDGDTLPMSVDEMGFLIDKLFDDCAPLQFLRELTKNSIESIERLPDRTGEVRWDVDWNRFELTGEKQVKLCIIDTGDGMTGPDMVRYINKLSSSIRRQSRTGNFGVGAKISAAPLNHEGLVYLSWRDGKGAMIHMRFDKNKGVYGLKRFKNGEFWTPVEDTIKPEPIKAHGTMVVLLGKEELENTMDAPPKAVMPRKWILRYLNTKFFRFPDGVAVKAREGWDLPRGDKHNFLRTVTGQGPWLDANAQASGKVDLPDSKATAHWWIIKEDADINSGHYAPGGHMAALFQDELYEMVHGNAAYARLQSFGVVFGGERVVIYVEPKNDKTQLVGANTSRSQLLIENEPLHWPNYAAEFRANMPDELAAYQDSIGLKSSNTDHKRAIQERLKTIQDLLRFSRYRPKKGGAHLIDGATANTGGSPERTGAQRQDGSGVGGGRGGMKGDIYSLFASDSGQPADAVNRSVEPNVKWVTVEDGTRTEGDLEDRAARYLADQNLLLINGDFRAFTDMVDRWQHLYRHVASSHEVIRDVVREWFEQQLVEAVMSAHGLKANGRWSEQELAELLSESALTAAVLPRYHINLNVKRTLGQRLGRLEKAA